MSAGGRPANTRLRIAGESFAICCPETRLADDMEAAYAPFLEGQAADDGPIGVHLHLGPAPDVPDLRRIFSSRPWSMYRQAAQRGDNYWLHMTAGQPAASPLWVARWDREVASVDVYCGSQLVSDGPGGRTLSSPLRYPLDQLLMMYRLARRRGLLVHAASLAMPGGGLVLAGKSGAGKSTVSRCLAGMPGSDQLSDDRVILRQTSQGWQAFGTPWPGEARVVANRGVGLRAVMFLAHATENRIEPLAAGSFLERLLPVVSIPWYDPDMLPAALETCEALVQDIPGYLLYFRPTAEVAALLADYLSVAGSESWPGRGRGPAARRRPAPP